MEHGSLGIDQLALELPNDLELKAQDRHSAQDGLALDLLVESLIIELASTSEAWKLHLKLAVAKGGFHFHRLRFWLERSDGSMVKTPKESLILESANSIIGVYGAQATVYESGEFEMTMCADIQGLPASLRSGV